jgi:hypothetical protein
MVQQATSSAETAKEIQSHLSTLQKSRQLRHRKNKDNRDLDRADALTLDKLRRIFARLKDDGCFDSAAAKDSASSKWCAWLHSQLDQFIVFLVEHIGDDKVYALRTFCGVIASFPDVASGSDASKREILSEKLLMRLLEAVFKSKKCFNANISNDRLSDEAMLTLLDTEFIQQYRDVQYYVLMVVQKVAFSLLEGREKDEKVKSAEEGAVDKQSSDETNDAEAEQAVEVVAENMARLLLKMDYIAKAQEDLMGDASFLFAPAVSPVVKESVGNEEDQDDDEEENGIGASDSDSSDEEDANKSAAAAKFTKQTKKSKLSPLQKAYTHRNLLQEAWLAVLRLSIPSRTTKLILQHLSTYILPIVPTPLRFAEYFTRSFQNGTIAASSASNNNGLTAILSLHGLFQLILNHQLEYPQFYPSLYKILHPRILYTKHRTRFLRLLSKSLMSNTMLPAYVVAAFCKKLLRLGLSGPPSGALFVLALVSNLVRKHGEVGCLIHRRGEEMEDVFVEDAENLIDTRGMCCIYDNYFYC